MFDDLNFVNDEEDEAVSEAFDVERWLAQHLALEGLDYVNYTEFATIKKKKKTKLPAISKSETINHSLTH